MQLTLTLDPRDTSDLALAQSLLDAARGHAAPAAVVTQEPAAADATPEQTAEPSAEKRGRGRPRKVEAAPEPSAVREPETADQQPEPVVNPEPVAEATPAPTPEPVAEATPAPTPEPVAEATPEPSADDFEAPAAVTLDDLRTQVRALMAKNAANKDAISGVLAKFGAKLLPDLKEADYAGVLAGLKAIA